MGQFTHPPPGQIEYPFWGPGYLPSFAVNLNLLLKRGSRNMARRVIVMDVVLEVIYQWHNGQR